ncbi:MAG: molybdopterin molybdotransferase MoeA [Candidatus Aureabacteria bacterium]|nr:molybdopterin molybdotransferase MoeA [Candidatus Auribacterota bacterium]
MITIEHALTLILNNIKVGPSTVVDACDALGLVFAEDARARNNIPPFDNSAMDGYAVRSADTRGASPRSPVILQLLEDVPAGHLPKKTLGLGWATKIMTGAPVPRGADAIIIVEDTEEKDGVVRCCAEVKRGENIRRSGEDVRKGEAVLRKGNSIRPQEMGMLAAMGRTRVRVIRRPRVAILATGDELIPPDRIPGPGQVRNCNNHSLVGLVKKCNAEPVDLGIAPDDSAKLHAQLREAAACDMIITSGGVSVGEHDLVKKVLAEMGAKMKFWQVCMKPGKPLAFGLIRGKPVFGLPGNPVSVIVSFEIFVRPAILRMMGKKRLDRPLITAILEKRIEKPADRVHFIRAKVCLKGTRYHASPTGPQGSGILKSLVMGGGLIVLPKAKTVAKAGEKVAVMMLDPAEE